MEREIPVPKPYLQTMEVVKQAMLLIRWITRAVELRTNNNKQLEGLMMLLIGDVHVYKFIRESCQRLKVGASISKGAELGPLVRHMEPPGGSANHRRWEGDSVL